MNRQDSHLSDEQLLRDLEGELSASDARLIRSHVEGCWSCRARRQQIEGAIADFVRIHQRQFEGTLPPADGPRALLRAHIADLSATPPNSSPRWFAAALGVGACAIALVGLYLVQFVARQSHPRSVVVSLPNSRLTPGAAVLAGRQAVCSQANPNNKAVPIALQRKVFQEYGIASAEPQAYEIDYLVTPALGGTDDIRNLWPHSYSATAWNARVKDALEDRLHEMVCGGSLDLTEAQREIAGDWIAAYKKYFHTDKPLEEHWRQRAP